MLFDSLVSIIERYYPSWKEYANQARLFYFPDVIDNPLGKEQFDYLYDNFFLPFPITGLDFSVLAINPKSSGEKIKEAIAGIIVDTGDERGLKEDNKISIFIQEIENKRLENLGELGEYFINMRKALQIKKVYAVSMGTFVKIDGGYAMGGRCTTDIFYDNNPAGHFDKDSPQMGIYQERFLQYSYRALMAILKINNPEYFILEEEPKNYELNFNRNKRAGKILRSAHRKRYTVLRPKEIRTKLGWKSGGEFKGNFIGDRRAHERILRHPRFTNMRWQRIFVQAHWVGPSETKIGKRKYKVLKDR